MWKQPKFPLADEWIKMWDHIICVYICVCTYTCIFNQLLLIHKKDSNTIKLFELYLLSTSFLSQGDLCIKEKEYLCLLICNEIKEEYAEIWASQVALVVKNSPTNAGNMRCEFDPWVWKIPWRRAWPPSPVFLPGESHWQKSLVGYSPQGCIVLDTAEVT